MPRARGTGVKSAACVDSVPWWSCGVCVHSERSPGGPQPPRGLQSLLFVHERVAVVGWGLERLFDGSR